MNRHTVSRTLARVTLVIALASTAFAVYHQEIFRQRIAALADPPVARAAPARPNVVFVLMDDLGYGDLASFGAPDARTPNIDSIGRDGARLANSYSSAPMCSPTRASFVTGRYQQRCGIEKVVSGRVDADKGLPVDETSVARMLKDGGYATALFGKWHLGTRPEFGPNAHGFDEFFGVPSNCDYFSHLSGGGAPLLYENTTPVDEDGYLTDLLTDRAVAYIDRHAGDTPFFLELAYTAVHVPHQDPDDPTDLRTKATWYDSTRADYVKTLERADVGVGRVLDALRAHGIERNTLVVFASDNGGDNRRDARNAPFRGGKYQLFEGGLRSPTLLRWPGTIPAGLVCPQISITMDLTATILSAAGVAPERPLDGIDLLPFLRDGAPPVARAIFWRNSCAQTGPTRAARVDKWKYVEFSGAPMLYDLERDEGETIDVARDNRSVVDEIRRRLDAWERDVDSTPHRFTVRCDGGRGDRGDGD